jgi:hypothetical protein
VTQVLERVPAADWTNEMLTKTIINIEIFSKVFESILFVCVRFSILYYIKGSAFFTSVAP